MPQSTVHDAPIGREAEIRAIHDALFGEAAGPRAIVLEGEPGIGKSALWRYAVELAEREQGARVLAVRPAHTEIRLAWAALADLLEPIDESMLAALVQFRNDGPRDVRLPSGYARGRREVRSPGHLPADVGS